MMELVVRPSDQVQRELLAAVEKATRAEASARERRVAAIRAAVDAGVPVTHIASSSGLSRTHIYRMLDA